MSTNKWVLDPTHSEIGFKVKHLMITNVSGNFAKFNAEAESTDDSFSDAKITFTADIDSISTNNEQRDGHLKSPDFFDAANHPHLTIEAHGLKGSGESRQLEGSLTLRGVTKPVHFNVDFGGVAKDPWGNTKAGFTLTGTINRKDFGLTWNAPTEAGGLLVSEDVKLHAEIQLVKQG